MSNHGYVTSCLGPVVDIQLSSDVYREDRSVYSRIRDAIAGSETAGQKTIYIGRDIFYPTVYDSITIVRPSVSFREGITMANCMTRFHTFILDIPYHETYLLAATHLIPVAYGSNLQIRADMEWAGTGHSFGLLEEAYSRTERTLAPNHRIDLILGFTTLYLLVRTYGNSLVAEVSQQMYGGILRCISLGATEGLSTWKCNIQLNVQAVVVPVGRVSLGRILNVVGAAVDLFDDQPTAIVYGESPICKGNVGGALGNGPVATITTTIKKDDSGKIQYYCAQHIGVKAGQNLLDLQADVVQVVISTEEVHSAHSVLIMLSLYLTAMYWGEIAQFETFNIWSKESLGSSQQHLVHYP
jgi:hypothetical protein